MMEMILDGAGAIDAVIAVALPATPRVAFYGVLSGAALVAILLEHSRRRVAHLPRRRARPPPSPFRMGSSHPSMSGRATCSFKGPRP